MTREEAIYNLKALLTMGYFRDAYGDSICAEPYYESVDMAIEALKNSERTEKSSQNVSNDDLISRKAAIDAICTEGTRLERNGTVAMVEIKQWCVDILEALPSAQPERKKGKWIYGHEYKIIGNPYGHYRCDQCQTIVGYETHFCPTCGAEMRGEE